MKQYIDKKYIPSYLAIFIGFILSCFIFYGIKSLEKRFIQYKFTEEKENYLNILNFELTQDINVLNAVEQLYLASKNVDREEFKIFTELFLKDNQKINALSWAPLVKDKNRSEYEKLAQLDGHKDFKFTEIDDSRKMIKRKDSFQYYPVYYIEPLIGNENALGFDLFSNKDRAETIMTSLRSGEIVGTSKIKLVQEKEDKYAFLLLNPVYKKIKNEEKFIGFISGVFRIDDVINSALALIKEKNLEFYIYDATEDLNTDIYTTKNYFNLLKDYEFTDLYFESTINFPNRDWKIRFIPGKTLFSNFIIKWEWLSFIFFNALSIVVGIYLYKKIKYTDRIETLMKDAIESEKKLKLSAQILANTPEGVMVTNRENNIISVNDSFLKTTGYLREDVVGHNPRILNSNHHKSSFYKEMWQSIKNDGIWQGEIWNRRKNGEIYPEWLNIMTINNEDNKNNIDYYVGIFSDLSNQKHVRDQIQHLAYYDLLTDLPNRALFNSKAKSLIINAEIEKKKIAFIFLDLDRFKNINDALGHYSGDQLLKEVAIKLKKVLLKNEIISRFGGDEFMILIPSFDFIDELEKRIKGILEIFKLPFKIEGKEFFITASMGISLYPMNGTSVNELIKNADTAMYFAKRSGRNTSKFYTKNMNSKLVKNLDLENKMRSGLKNNEFYLDYQPQVSTKTKKIVSCEGLIRWKSPEFGIISPNEFINIAEDSGLILPMTRWILETVFREIKTIVKLNPEIYVSINISGYQIKHGNILEMIEEVLEKEDINLNNIELELTESMLMDDISKNLEVMKKLKNLKLKLAIDDFGTGYSSLSYLKKFPIDKLKINKSFIDGIPDNEDDNVIVKTIISMAHNLGLKVTAEGVETKGQFEFLKEYKCDEIQGYYFSKPVAIEKIQEYLEKDTFNLK